MLEDLIVLIQLELPEIKRKKNLGCNLEKRAKRNIVQNV